MNDLFQNHRPEGSTEPRYYLLDAESVRMNGAVNLIKQMTARKEQDLARHDIAIDTLIKEITTVCVEEDWYRAPGVAKRNLQGLKSYFSGIGISYKESDFDCNDIDPGNHRLDGILAATYRASALYNKWRTDQIN